MVILVTGTPGTGKTTFAKKLAADKGYAYVDLREFAMQHGFVMGTDKKRDALIIDDEQLMERLSEQFERETKVVLDGHFSHEFPVQLTEVCYVLKANLPVLKRRLEERGYSEQKVKENVEAEIFDVCQQEARALGHNVIVVWT